MNKQLVQNKNTNETLMFKITKIKKTRQTNILTRLSTFLPKSLKQFATITLIFSIFAAPIFTQAQFTDQTTKSSKLFLDQIRKSILPSGAIGMYPLDNLAGESKIVPYWSNLAVCGLASEIKFGDPANVENLTWLGWNALSWHAYRQDQSTGIVTDWQYKDGVETSTGEMDSVDSYSATFLMGLSCMFKATNDWNKTRQYLPSMRLAIQSIVDLQDKDGLTWTKPNYKVKYLMDNIEVVNGLNEARSILTRAGDYRSISTTIRVSNLVQRAINTKMWNTQKNAYKWAFAGDIPQEIAYETDWKIYYPDALENIWPSTFNLPQHKIRGNNLVQTFANNIDNYKDGGSLNGKWNPFVGLGFMNIGNRYAAQDSYNFGYQSIENNQVGGLYTSGHAGVYLVLHYKLKNSQSLIW